MGTTTLDWRDTLRTLLPQFEALATRSSGLNHLMVEVPDDDRSQMSGPSWFSDAFDQAKIVDGKLQYETWDCCGLHGLPSDGPAFREPDAGEEIDEDGPRGVIRDANGVVRAVPIPINLRQGYYCGQPREITSAYESLANAAATALAGASDLNEHFFASDLTDIFRKPRGGVRYVFGDVPGVPNQFIAQGWNAGVLQFDDGIVVDVPLAEMAPSSDSWTLLLHRLGWRCVDGSGLRATRNAWNDNTEVAVELLERDPSIQLKGFSEKIEGISKDSFYSVLGTKDSPLDVSLASAFAIQLLLADLAPSPPAHQPDVELPSDYSSEHWKLLPLPTPRGVTLEEAKASCQPTIGILVATDVEREAVLKKMRPPKSKRAILQVHSGSNTFFIGRLGSTHIALSMSAMGSLGRDASMMTTTEMIGIWQLPAVVMVGIAFGKDANKQDIGTVLVSDRIVSYEPQRVSSDSTEDRSTQTQAGSVLLNRCRNVIGWNFQAPSGRRSGFQVGPILSGEKLVDNPDFKQELFGRFPMAIGGEMEGAGLAAAAERNKCEWIVVKAICDWGDGQKGKHHQGFAAASSVNFVEHVLNQPGVLDSLAPNQ